MTEQPLDEAAVAAHWDRNAAQWSRDVQAGYDLYRETYTWPAFQAFLPNLKDKQAIDLGCGEGSHTRRFAAAGARVTGIDLSERFLAEARRREAERPLGIRYEQASFSDLSAFAEGSFDLAFSTMALMDGPDFAGAMREAHRVLRPGGRLLFSILHPCFITPALKWIRDEAGTEIGLQVGRYFETEPFVERWYFSKRPSSDGVVPFEVPRFPRTLADYINAVAAPGFRIRRIEEPQATEEAAQKHPWLRRWRRHAPLVLFVDAAKDA